MRRNDSKRLLSRQGPDRTISIFNLNFGTHPEGKSDVQKVLVFELFDANLVSHTYNEAYAVHILILELRQRLEKNYWKFTNNSASTAASGDKTVDSARFNKGRREI